MTTLINMSTETLTLVILAIAILPIIALMVYAIVVALRRSSKKSDQREIEINESIDNSQIELFTTVYGGKDNIKNVIREMSRISVAVVDIDKVEVEKLKELGANGVLLVGEVVKCSFGDRSPYIYNILKGGIGNDK